MAARLLVGALLAFFVYGSLVGPKTKEPKAPNRLIKTAMASNISLADVPDNSERIIELAQTDQVALLQWALENYERQISDYSSTFYKQERINGTLRPIEKIAVRFKERPFSLLMDWQENAGLIDKLLYVAGDNDDKMVVHPTGLLAWIKSVKRDPHSPQVRQSSRRSCDKFGFHNLLTGLLDVYEQAIRQGDLQIGYLGRTEVGGRECIAIERLLPAKEQYPCARLVLDFDIEYVLPTAIASYDWQDRLISRYVYEDLQFNLGMTQAEFTLKANGL